MGLFERELHRVRTQHNVSRPLNLPMEVLQPTPRLVTTDMLKQGMTAFLPEMRAGNDSISKALRLGRFRQQTIKEYCEGAFSVVSAITQLWATAVNSRRDYIMISEELRKIYIVDGLLEMISQDVLNADETGAVVEFTSSDDELQEELDELQDRFDFNTILHEVVRDFIDYGEYTLKMTVKPGEGVTEIEDSVDQINILAFYERGFPAAFMQFVESEYEVYPPHEFVHFCMGQNKMRIKLEAQLSDNFTLTQDRYLTPELRAKLPDYIRIGKPTFYGIVAKLRELQLLEQLIPATKLNQITQSTFVTVSVPPSMTPDEVMDVLRQYEDMLNMPTGIDQNHEQLSLAEILTAAGKVRVIPKFMDDKGHLEAVDLRKQQSVDDILQSVNDIRRVILSSIGIPPSLMFGSTPGAEKDAEKAQELRLFSRYTRRLASIQRSLARGLQQVVLTHLINRGHDVNTTDFDIVFKQSLVDLSGLEKLEFDDAKQEIFSKTVDLIDKIFANEFIRARLDEDELATFLREKLTIVTNGAGLMRDDTAVDGTKPQSVRDVFRQAATKPEVRIRSNQLSKTAERYKVKPDNVTIEQIPLGENNNNG